MAASLVIQQFTDLRLTSILRTIDTHVFPVIYADSYYAKLKGYPSDLSYIAFFGGVPVGSVTARLEDRVGDPDAQVCYIMTLGVLKPYRNRGIARRLIETLIAAVRRRPEVSRIILNVQVGSPAFDFYRKLGFLEVGDVVKEYYHGLDCNDAHHLELSV